MPLLYQKTLNVLNSLFDGQTIVNFCKKIKITITKKNLVYDTYADEFNSILSNCVTKPWNFDKGGEKEIDADNPNAVKITLKASLTENELKYIIYSL